MTELREMGIFTLQARLYDIERVCDEGGDDAGGKASAALYEGRGEDSRLALDGRVNSGHDRNCSTVVIMLDLRRNWEEGSQYARSTVECGVSLATCTPTSDIKAGRCCHVPKRPSGRIFEAYCEVRCRATQVGNVDNHNIARS